MTLYVRMKGRVGTGNHQQQRPPNLEKMVHLQVIQNYFCFENNLENTKAI